jgi:hypothetical protein
MHSIPVALSSSLGQIAMQNSEHGMSTASPARAAHFSAQHSGCNNWQRGSWKMMKGRQYLGGRESCIDGAQVGLRNEKERTKD